MKKNWSDYFTATMVLICSAVLLTALTIALSGYRFKKGDDRGLQIDYPDVTGIRLHSEVRYAGAPAGSVIGIRHLTVEERQAAIGDKRKNAVRVTISLLPDVPLLPDDVKATLASETMLSDKFVALSAGTPDAPRLADNALLQGQAGGSIDDLINALPPILKTVETTIASLEPVVKKATETLDTLQGGIKDVMPRVSKVADEAKTVAESADVLIKRADKLIADSEAGIKGSLEELQATMNKLQEVLGTADSFVGRTDKELAGRMKELSVILQNLKVATTHAKAATETLAKQPHRLIFGGKPNRITPESEILRSDVPVPATVGAPPVVPRKRR